MQTLTLKHGDCVQRMAEMAEASIDAIVCDPPYGLRFMQTKERTWDDLGDGAAQREWHKAWLAQAYRVLVPYGVLWAFCGTRTHHHLSAAMTTVGFTDLTIRAWGYATGFPKSLDVSKAIDQRGGQSIAWFVKYVEEICAERGIPKREITALFPSRNGKMTGWFWNKRSGVQDMTLEQFNRIRDFLGLPFADMKEAERQVIGVKAAGIGSGKTYAFHDNINAVKTVNVTAPATTEAVRWQGYGTALRPSWEPVVCGRKPA